MTNGRRVLVVDGLTETEEVLKAVLEPRGLQVDRIRANRTGEELRGPDRPNVLVLHEDDTRSEKVDREGLGRIPRVVIGSARMPAQQGRGRHYLQKPFQYRELIQAVERLLDDRVA